MPREEFFLAFVTLVAGTALLFPVARALAERIRSRAPAPPASELRAELTQLHERLTGDVEQLRREIAELAERVDFAERLLAKQREGERLAPPRA